MLEHVHAMAQSVQTNVGATRLLRLSPRVLGDMGLRVKNLELRVWCIQTNLGAVRALLLSLFE